jgi:hypothetical protein
MNEWSELKQRVLNGALKHLDSLGVSYKVITPAGEHGTLQVVPPKPVKPAKVSTRKKMWFAHGELAAHYKAYLAELPVGGEVVIPTGKFTLKELQTNATSWCAVTWGKGSYVSMKDNDKKTLTILRVA